MNDDPLSILLLAWDDADPAPGALGAGLPAGAALRHALAARLSLTAILPQQPASEDAAGRYSVAELNAPTAVASDAAAAVFPIPIGAGPEATGTKRAGTAGTAPTPASARLALSPPRAPVPGAPLLIGLAEFTVPELEAQARRWGSRAPGSPLAGGRQAPAAPYVGSSLAPATSVATAAAALPARTGLAGPNSAPGPGPIGAPAAATGLAPAAPEFANSLPTAFSTPRFPLFGLTGFDLESAAPPTAPAFGEATEPGAAEAADLAQWADDLTLADTDTDSGAYPAGSPAPVSRPAALAALRQPEPAGPPEGSLAAGSAANPDSAITAGPTALAAAASLSFRIIQYARFATQLTAGGTGFGVIFATAWPCWLAAAEIRQRTGQPLLLYVTSLPSAAAPPRARGWLRALEQQALRQADVVLVPDAAFGAALAARFALRQPPRVLPPATAPAGPAQTAAGLAAFVLALLPTLRPGAPAEA